MTDVLVRCNVKYTLMNHFMNGLVEAKFCLAII